MNNIIKNTSSPKNISLVDKYKFSNQYFVSPETLKEEIIEKTIIPHQVEFLRVGQGVRVIS